VRASLVKLRLILTRPLSRDGPAAPTGRHDDWLEHPGENTGETETHVISIELREPPTSQASSAADSLGPSRG